MPVDRSYAAENDAERERLRSLVQHLSDQDLARPMEAGWTVAGVLGHLAFWDQRIIALLDEWERAGPSWTPPVIDERHVDWINDAAKALCLALPPRVAAELAVSVAEAVDRRVAAVSEATIEANARAGAPLSWRRAEHRREHLDEIERRLGRARPGDGPR
jgi:Mycothiol maleylpyruvate isomerase N-terminal domain